VNLRTGGACIERLKISIGDFWNCVGRFVWQGIVAGRARAMINPQRRWSVTAQYLDLWLASAKDAAYSSRLRRRASRVDSPESNAATVE
jgi:hypothetical protein